MAVQYGGRPAGGTHWRLSWNDRNVRSIVYQIAALAAVVAGVWYFVDNTLENLRRLGLASGFGFMDREAAFPIGESLIDYTPADTYARALLVGVINTLYVSAIGIILATVLGTVIGIARLSRNWLIAKLASVYVEMTRNTPLLLQLFFWYMIFLELLPPARQALQPVPDVFLSNRGVRFPVPAAADGWSLMGAGVVIGVVGAMILSSWSRRRQAATGQQFPVVWAGLAAIVGCGVVGWLLGGAPTALDRPALRGFNFSGGVEVSPEFVALLLGLVIYTAAFVAEIVRGGILAISQGQTEAASALGLKRGMILRLVILPQALRVIIPPITSQYLNLTKNSSLAVAIGFPDLVHLANTAINQTGQAIEGIAIIMAVYLTISLSISLFMNWYNRRVALVER
ncbi:MAG: amino acid ABC transporter permease [Alphaproteobacteria bacterium]|nr:amino acid ABC transporter permease [Alphaproteobacteria bacterium]